MFVYKYTVIGTGENLYVYHKSVLLQTVCVEEHDDAAHLDGRQMWKVLY